MAKFELDLEHKYTAYQIGEALRKAGIQYKGIFPIKEEKVEDSFVMERSER